MLYLYSDRQNSRLPRAHIRIQLFAETEYEGVGVKPD